MPWPYSGMQAQELGAEIRGAGTIMTTQALVEDRDTMDDFRFYPSPNGTKSHQYGMKFSGTVP